MKKSIDTSELVPDAPVFYVSYKGYRSSVWYDNHTGYYGCTTEERANQGNFCFYGDTREETQKDFEKGVDELFKEKI